MRKDSARRAAGLPRPQQLDSDQQTNTDQPVHVDTEQTEPKDPMLTAAQVDLDNRAKVLLYVGEAEAKQRLRPKKPVEYKQGDLVMPVYLRESDVISLTGWESLIPCYIGGVWTYAVWDSGSSVSVVTLSWVEEHLPDYQVQPLAELKATDRHDPASYSLPFIGWIGAAVSLAHAEDDRVLVPLYVTSGQLDWPKIGLNAIQELYGSQAFPAGKQTPPGPMGPHLDERRRLLGETKELRAENSRLREALGVLRGNHQKLKGKSQEKKGGFFSRLQRLFCRAEDTPPPAAPQAPPQAPPKVAKLRQRLTEVPCNIGGVETTAVWDTGAVVSMVCRDWLREHLPDLHMHRLQELPGRLEVTSADGTPVSFEGWVEVQVSVGGSEGSELLVPFLVAPDPWPSLIGMNVIHELFRPSRRGEVPVVRDFRGVLHHREQLLAEKEELQLENRRMEADIGTLEEDLRNLQDLQDLQDRSKAVKKNRRRLRLRRLFWRASRAVAPDLSAIQ